MNIRNASGNTILLRLSIHCATCCGVIVVKLLSLANVGRRANDLRVLGGLSSVSTEPEQSFSFSLLSSILTDGIFIVLGKLC